MRDFCADGALLSKNTLESFTITIGSTLATINKLNIAENIYTAENCPVTHTYEVYDLATEDWTSIQVGAPSFVSDLGTSYLDYFIEIDLDWSDDSSAIFSPTSSFDLRITAIMEDSV